MRNNNFIFWCFFPLAVALLAPFFSAAVGKADNGQYKKGTSLNIIGDVAWKEMLPVKIASIPIGESNFDAPDVTQEAVCICPAPYPKYYRIGISFGFWDPNRMIETVSTPYYFPFLGKMISASDLTKGFLSGADTEMSADGRPDQTTFAQAHYWMMPLMYIVDMFIDDECKENDTAMDIVYMTELDPMWQDDEVSAIIQPEALLFANPAAQLACIADAIAVNALRPIDIMFWCMGTSGSAYPLTGNVGDPNLNQGNFAMAARMIYKLNREFLICDTAMNLCECKYTPIWVKSHYKLQPARPVKKSLAWPIGKSAFAFGSMMNPPVHSQLGPSDEYLWILFRKKTCCMSN